MADRPDRLIFVYNGDSGWVAMLQDAVKKAFGREECSLCEITYSPVGKRRAWLDCEKRLACAVEEMHRDRLPSSWGISPGQWPCILAQSGEKRPSLLVAKDALDRCERRPEALEALIAAALATSLAPEA